jgi:hypothetical protein
MTVTRTGDSTAPPVLPEQVYRRPFRALRDAVPHLSATPVVVRTDEAAVRAFLGRGASKRSFSFDDESYVARAEPRRDDTATPTR